MKSVFNGERLKEARLFNQYTITALAEKLNVSKQMVSKYENLNSQPSKETLFQMSNLLKFPIEFFLTTDDKSISSNGLYFRSYLTSTQKEKEPATYWLKYALIIRDYLNQYVDFPDLKDPSGIADTIDIQFKNLELSDIEEIALKVRESIGYDDAPIENMVEFSELLGISVINNNSFSEKVDAFSSSYTIRDNEYFMVSIPTEVTFFRQQFSLAHEIGHWILHEGINPQKYEKEEYKLMEQDANNFASCLLMPADRFAKDVKNIGTHFNGFLVLKKRWNVSIASMIMRTYQLGLIDSKEKKSLFKHMSYKGYRKVEPYDLEEKVNKPVAIRQAMKLLDDNSIKSGAEIRDELAEQYNLYLNLDILSQVSDLPKQFFVDHNKSSVVLSLKDFGTSNTSLN